MTKDEFREKVLADTAVYKNKLAKQKEQENLEVYRYKVAGIHKRLRREHRVGHIIKK